MTKGFWVLAVLVGLYFMLIIAALLTGAAYAHDAPSGWRYDPSCCNTVDCRPADGPDGPRHHNIQILETAEGYVVVKPGAEQELVPYGSKKIRDSKDNDYHVCTYGGSDITGVICLYVPFRGY